MRNRRAKRQKIKEIGFGDRQSLLNTWFTRFHKKSPGLSGALIYLSFYFSKLRKLLCHSEPAYFEGVERFRGLTWSFVEIFGYSLARVRAKVVPNVKREILQNEILKNIHHGSTVYSDQAVAYDKLKENYIHDTVNHVNAYVEGNVHTKGWKTSRTYLINQTSRVCPPSA